MRPPNTERTKLYRLLEDGATGLMIPLQNTKEDVASLVEKVKFPPLGTLPPHSLVMLEGKEGIPL